MTFRLLAFIATAMAAFFLSVATEASTLDQVRKRGFLICGANNSLAGFGQQDENGEWSGFDVDFCRAMAAAIFDDPKKVRFAPISGKERFKALQSSEVDVLSRNSAWTLSRDTGQGLLYATITFFDGQGFLAAKKRAIASLQDLAGHTVCVQEGTPLELDLVDYFRAREKQVEPRLFATFEEAARAYAAGQCEALTADVSALAVQRSKLDAPGDHLILPDLIDKEPLGPLVRQGDDQWFNIVRWTHFAMLDAEELGVTSANVDQQLKSDNPHVRRLLGVDGARGEGLGLENDWIYRIVKHIGNYGEIFERNLGRATPLELDRRLNALWTKGGLMYAPPVR